MASARAQKPGRFPPELNDGDRKGPCITLLPPHSLCGEPVPLIRFITALRLSLRSLANTLNLSVRRTADAFTHVQDRVSTHQRDRENMLLQEHRRRDSNPHRAVLETAVFPLHHVYKLYDEK